MNRAPKLPKLLSLEIGLAILPVVAVMLHYPSTPHAPPSVAAAAARSSATEAKHKAAASLLSSLKPLFTFSFICMILAGGLNMGVYGLWSGVLTEVLPSSWSDAEKGMFGLVNTVCSVVGGLLGGVITDWKFVTTNNTPPRARSIADQSLQTTCSVSVRILVSEKRCPCDFTLYCTPC